MNIRFTLNWLFLLFLFHSSCNSGPNISQAETAKKEILQTEKEFAALCQQQGLEKAFTTYAATDAVILMPHKMLRGKAQIKQNYAQPAYKLATLQWAPDFVDASAAGDLGYTYGHYVFTTPDSLGNPTEHKGTFHTVWKKVNGKWKFVWDN